MYTRSDNVVQIAHPTSDGNHYSNRKSAIRLVRRGLEVFEDGASKIRLLNQVWHQLPYRIDAGDEVYELALRLRRCS
jgi:hypothetical protein